MFVIHKVLLFGMEEQCTMHKISTKKWMISNTISPGTGAVAGTLPPQLILFICFFIGHTRVQDQGLMRIHGYGIRADRAKE